MRPTGTAAELQKRRFLAVQRLRDGYAAQQVADFLGVHIRTVRSRKAAFRKRGDKGLRSRPPPGRPRFLTARQERAVLAWFRTSPRSFGYRTDLWTARRVAEVIRRKWQVDFNHRYLNAWLARRGITPQKPQRVPREADRAAIDRWRSTGWVRLQNGRDASGPPLSASTNAA